MPLLDHFRAPLSLRRHWHSFHNAWSTYLAAHLNEQLPEGYFAEPNVQFGIEIDVATFEEVDVSVGSPEITWIAPAPTATVPIALVGDLVEVLIYEREGGPTLAGAIELVSPSNKDRPDSRAAFVSKCAAYLQQGIGLLMIDIVTSRGGNLHLELMSRLDVPFAAVPSAADAVQPSSELYSVAYRPVQREGEPSLELWEHALTLGKPLATMPLWLRGGICLPVDLEATYHRTCQEQRILAEAV